jgi:RNA polymerase primary sigma factor
MNDESRKYWEDLNLYYQYIKDIDRYPLLTRKEERELLRRIKEKAPDALKKLVCANLKFVINVAFKYRGQGFTLPELINEGNIGLVEAAERFDLNKNIRFISYAVWWIRQSITRAIAEKARIVRISAEKELIIRRINRYNTRMKYVINGGLKIDAKDLGKKMGYTSKKMEKILEMGQHHSSLDQPVDGDSGTSIVSIIKNRVTEDSDERAVRMSRNAFLERTLKRLNDRERKVIKMYYGIDTNEELSLEDIGDLIGLSKERVRQIKEEGLANLRKFELPKELLLAA